MIVLGEKFESQGNPFQVLAKNKAYISWIMAMYVCFSCFFFGKRTHGGMV